MQILGYIRVSGRSQIEGDGPERQRETILAFCKQNGLEFKGEFFEKAVSGTVEGMGRPEFTEMLFRAEEGKIDAIVVERMDRLARDLMVSEIMLAECRKKNIKVFSADQGALIDMASDGGDPTRILIRQIMGALAQWEKAQLVKKLSIARARKRAKFGKCEGRQPKNLSERELAVLKFLSGVQGGMSLAGMAQMLNDSGIPPFRQEENWSKQKVARLIEHAKKKGQW